MRPKRGRPKKFIQVEDPVRSGGGHFWKKSSEEKGGVAGAEVWSEESKAKEIKEDFFAELQEEEGVSPPLRQHLPSPQASTDDR